jgi:putative transposase
MQTEKFVRRNGEQWQRIVDNWSISGLSAPKYCKQHQLSYAAFSNWRRHFSNTDTTAQHHRSGEFLNLSSLSEPIASGWHITLKLGGNIELVLSRQ